MDKGHQKDDGLLLVMVKACSVSGGFLNIATYASFNSSTRLPAIQ